MKTGFFTIFAVAAGQLVLAFPHREVRHYHAARDLVTDTVTVTVPEEIIVYVDGDGNTLSVDTVFSGATRLSWSGGLPTPAAVSAKKSCKKISAPTQATALSSVVPVVVGPSSAIAATVTSSSVMASISIAASASAVWSASSASAAISVKVSSISASLASASSYEVPSYVASSVTPTLSEGAATFVAVASSAGQNAVLSGGGLGLTYSPYSASGSCKTQNQINTDFNGINGYQMVRIYGTDCGQVPMVLQAASSKGLKVMLGIFDLTNLSSDVQTIISAVNGNWSPVDTISVCNECVNQGLHSVGDVVNAVNSVRSELRTARFTGPVVTVDTFDILIQNPQLCGASDYCAANCHAFFDSSVEASGAGDYVLQQAQQVSDAAGGKETVITESGWPSAGSPNGLAVPSEANQKTAISSLKSAFASNIFLFTAYNDLWKQPGPFNVEQHWGIFGTSSS
ncbi:MAG: hypothetical protein M1834_001490 [Cirrosporium novae-zelandiae]|nr:MAG: hypothetical protein M1834_008604 [Cirrosporium novae-zelandiae]KAI9736024.1 MAG: hypothetical protein M1834_001490 [Cirrosporium novae-zelandiae]